MIGKRKQSKARQHRVPPTTPIVVSALLNSVYNAETDKQIFAAIDAMTSAVNALSSYDLQGAEEFVKLGLGIPEE